MSKSGYPAVEVWVRVYVCVGRWGVLEKGYHKF